VPIANLRREPVEMGSKYTHDEIQLTQVLYNEKLLLKKNERDWCFVEAVEQKTFKKEKGWQGYPGWIKSSNIVAPKEIYTGDELIIKSKVSPIYEKPTETSRIILNLLLGTRLFIAEDMGIDNPADFYNVMLANGQKGWIKKDNVFLAKKTLKEKDLRKLIIGIARLFIGTPYLWGGRSINTIETDIPTGVDCSGLVNLSYRCVNIDLPRDARDQWLVSESIFPEQMDEADLIFISEENHPENIVHVMLYAGEDILIEAYETGSYVREISFYERFGLRLSSVKDNTVKIKNRYIYFKGIKFNED